MMKENLTMNYIDPCSLIKKETRHIELIELCDAIENGRDEILLSHLSELAGYEELSKSYRNAAYKEWDKKGILTELERKRWNQND